MSDLIGKRLQQYKINYMLGQGGMAAVYAATDTETNQDVAIKVMHSHLAGQQLFRQHFLREANTVAALRHPNIVRVDNWGGGDELLLVMQLIDGLNLRQYMQQLRSKNLSMPYAEAIEIIRQLAETLHYAHTEHKIIHRDMKPDNVVLDRHTFDERLGYRPILTDFGLASIIEPTEKALIEQKPAGTYPYMSPEQTQGLRTDARTDIYALGIMLYELTTGTLPFSPKNLREAVSMHTQEEVALPSTHREGFNPDLEAIIMKTLVKNPDGRLSTAADLAMSLENLLRPVSALDPESAPVIVADEDDDSTILETIIEEETPPPQPPFDIAGREPELLGQDCIIFYGGSGSYILPITDVTTTIGREIDDDIRVTDNFVSRNHLRIARQPNGLYVITDRDSLNGTWFDEQEIQNHVPTLISPYQMLRLGGMWMQLLPAIDLAPIYVQEDVIKLRKIALSTEVGEGQDTQIMGIPPEDSRPDMPAVPLSEEQLQYDRIILYSDDDPEIKLLNQDRILLGRADRRDIQLDDPAVSLLHARIDRVGDGTYQISDLASTNGVFFGNRRITSSEPVLLANNQDFRIGTFWMKFEQRAALAAQANVKAVTESSDHIETVVMIRALDEDIPPISEPAISQEVRASDRLLLFSQDSPLQIIRLDQAPYKGKEIISIGRGSDQDIKLSGRRLSREHGRLIMKKNGDIEYIDLGSTNGTWMGSTLIVPDTQVLWQKTSVMRLGNYWMQYVRGEQDFLGARLLNDEYRRVGQAIGVFRVDRFIGQNALTAVYKAYDTRNDAEVALRVLHPQLAKDMTMKQRFLEEGRILSRVVHPNIQRIFSFYDADSEVFMAAELLTGGSLRRFMMSVRDEGRLLSVEDALKVTLQIANGLTYAHEQGLIYRDLRPEGVVLRQQGDIHDVNTVQPVLTDFTLLRYADAGEIFEDKRISGNPYAYSSPEQLRNQRIDARSDIFELGIILYELLVGTPPFEPRGLAEAVEMYTRQSIPEISKQRTDVPVQLEELVKQTLQVDPDDRYQTSGAMARAIQRVLQKLGASEQETEDLLFQTVSMQEMLPAVMPLRTEPPRSSDDLEYDRLIFYSDMYPTVVVRITENLYTIGRDESQDIQLSGRHVSRRHARIEIGVDGYFRIMDVGSSNGSWLGTYRLINNVAEIWESDETVRISDYWVRIDRAIDYQRARDMRAYLPGAMPDEYSTDPGDGGAQFIERELEPEKIIVNVEQPRIEVEPGSRAVMSLEIVNQDEVVDHFVIDVRGLPSSWYSVQVDSVYLLPLNRETASIEFHPPLDVSASAGAHAFEVHVSSRSRTKHAVHTQASLVINQFYNFKSEFAPERIRRRGTGDLFIANTGNIATTYSIQVRDSEKAVQFQLEGRQYRLLPGEEALLGVQVKARKRIWFGSPQIYPFLITVSPNPTNDLSPPQTHNGELHVRPACAVWMIGVLVILGALLIAAGIFAYTAVSGFIAEQATATVAIQATESIISVTQQAAEDDDGDGLSNAYEAEIGTFSDLTDTDEDGLDDGAEIRIWNTEPLNRDTDGDNLSDGDEVNIYGTNPTKSDTDEDGVPDDQDVDPLRQATPTITPLPTIPGSEGDICPGSPVPSRIEVGMRAEVEPGGVANRLRAEPDAEAEIITQMPPESSFIVVGGPECDEASQLRWWQVEYGDETGWTAEGEEGEYYICPPDECETEGETDADSSDASAPSDIDVVSLTIPAPSNSINTNTVGVQILANMSSDDWSTVLNEIAPLNPGWVKVQVNWRQLQPDGPGTRSDSYRSVLSNLETVNNQGYNILVSITKAPDWARTTTDQDGPPDNPEQLATFVELLIGDANYIDAIEVWNEPNLLREWNGTLPFNGGGYMQLFSPVYNLVQEQAPQIQLVTAGLAPTSTTDVSVNDRDFLWQMYDVGLDNFQGVAIGVHPFGWGNAPDSLCCDVVEGRGWDDQPQFFFFNTINSYRNVMNSYSDDKDLWITEFGWSSWQDLSGSPPEEWMQYISVEEQGEYLFTAIDIAQQLDSLGPMFIWNANFADNESVARSDEMAGYSLLYRDASGNYSRRIGFSVLLNR